MAAIPFVVFVVVMVIVLGGYWLFVIQPEHQAERAVRARLKDKRPRLVTMAGFIKARDRLSSIATLDAVLERREQVVAPLAALIARSGLRVTVGMTLLGSMLLALIAFVAVLQLTHRLPIALLVSAGVAVVPVLYIRRCATKRMAAFEEQFPEAIDLIARALRAGHALPTALQMVGEEVAEPAGSEFRLLFDQQNFGMSLAEALRAFGERISLVDARFFVTAILTQREMGGNLSEVLEKLAAVIRERFKVKRHVRAVSAHGRITGVVLGFLPPAVAAVLLIISPAHIRLLADDPLGVDMVMIAIVLQVIGVFIIRRIVDVEY
jgi:tight adherence protein B